MKYFLYNTPLYSGKPGLWILMKDLIKQPDGTVTVLGFNDQVLSVQPGGAWHWAPLGTAGQYEKATQNGAMLVFNPSDQTSQPFAYPFITSEV